MTTSTEKVAVVRDTYIRYNPSERANHWLVVVCAILLMLSGLAFFHPAFFWLTALFGGGQAARAIHPWIGVVLAGSFTFMGIRFFRQNIWTKEDGEWMSHVGDLINHREDKVPEAGRFNAAQKLVFYVMFWSVVTLFLSGLVLWQHYFGDAFPMGLQRFAGLVHALMAAAMIITMIIHIYAAIWNTGSVRAMTRGPVTGGWLWKHHRRYLREEVGGRK
ncbi:formate dehydrogenase-O, cytochrome b556 subunit [Magnetospirillum sp. LM-5]|uniref:formate dehydrogenase subunit gamma n=1 Tax=Magnetospirillum sp. LM-5 TaxID=2681466 RepID=UPI00137FDAF8|nr:formate dehydrogenase subunit gamma [Magnetospirillum sp. LM-5]CAA7623461.1 formate dehydrogenase-O, cytochrome b556 subunit [Magnetospirillum sp. LM-5]